MGGCDVQEECDSWWNDTFKFGNNVQSLLTDQQQMRDGYSNKTNVNVEDVKKEKPRPTWAWSISLLDESGVFNFAFSLSILLVLKSDH